MGEDETAGGRRDIRRCDNGRRQDWWWGGMWQLPEVMYRLQEVNQLQTSPWLVAEERNNGEMGEKTNER